MLSTEDYLDKIEPYLNDLTGDHKTQGEWNIQLIMAINFTSSKGSDKTHTMHTKSDNIEIMKGNEIDQITEELFNSLLEGYKKNLEESMKGSDLVLIVLIYCTSNFIKQV